MTETVEELAAPEPLGGEPADEGPPARPHDHLDDIIEFAPELVLAVVLATWSVVFFYLGRLRYQKYGAFGFDLGIYDQGTWLLSRFRDPFVTIRGLEIFGHHANFILLAFVPFYWLGAGPVFLLGVQVVAQACGGIALFLLGRDILKSRWAGVGMASAWCLNPTNQWLVWEFFHPDAVAMGPLLLAYWAARTKRWGFFTGAAIVALACKEDAALTLVVLGLLIIVHGDRIRGAAVAAIAAAWFLIATRVVIPFSNGIGPFYDTFFGNLGKTPPEVIFNSVRHPTESLKRIRAHDAKGWYWKMWAPWALTPLLDLRTLAIAFPMIFIDVMSEFPYTRVYMYHYSAMVLVGSAVASLEAIGWISRRSANERSTRTALVLVVLACALFTTTLWGASPISHGFQKGMWPLRPDPLVAEKAALIRELPSSAAVSTAYNLDTHIDHRSRVYEFPVPWCNINWGVKGEHLDNPDTVDWILMDRGLVQNPRDRALFDDLLEHEFKIVDERSGVLLAKRIAPPAIPSTVNPPNGECYARQSLASYQPDVPIPAK